MLSRRVVLLHGFLGSANSFDAVLDALRLDEPPLCPALYGHGAPVHLRPTYGFHDEVRRLLELIEPYSGGVRVHLAGYSLGARLALGLLSRAPQLFHSVTLVSGRRGLDTPQERADRLVADQRWARQLTQEPLRDFLTAWEQQDVFASMRHWPLELREALRRQRAAHNPAALANAIVALSLANTPSLSGELTHLFAPTTVLAGEQDPKFVALGKDLASRMPNGKFVVVDRAGHQLLIERPDAVAAAIRQGLDNAERILESSPDL
jgi:2-succinyl-6-hydroxy-2,4-cyclohexadiene-1-carboxylate synthase